MESTFYRRVSSSGACDTLKLCNLIGTLCNKYSLNQVHKIKGNKI